jgi:NRPS condensation-like uncharacterized protein
MTLLPEEHDTPIPLTLVEKYFLLDTSEEYPMLIEQTLELSGNLNREYFECAVCEALKKHPLFLKKIERKHGKYFWRSVTEPFMIRWLESASDTDTALGTQYRDILANRIFEIAVYRTETESVIYFLCHHTATDGVGLFRFWGDVFAEYARRQGESPVEIHPIRPERIQDRDKYQAKEFPEKMSSFRITWETVKGISQWLFLKPVALGEKIRSDRQPVSGFGKKNLRISALALKSLLKFARSRLLTINDLLLDLFFVSVSEWQKEIFSTAEKKYLRVNIPVNMRWNGSEDIPAANIISYVYLILTRCHVLL